MSNFSLTAFLGLDTKRFKDGIDDADRRVQRFQRLLGTLGLAVGVNQLVAAFRSIVKYANEAESGVDKNIDAVQRWSRQMEDLKKSALGVGAAIVGSMNRAGEWLGDAISKTAFGASQADLDAIRKSEATIEAMEKNIEKIRERNKKLADEAVKMEEENDKKRKQAALNRMSELEKEAHLKKLIKEASGEIADIEATERGADGKIGHGPAYHSLEGYKKVVIEAEEELDRLIKSRQERELALENQIRQAELNGYTEAMSKEEQLEEMQARRAEAEEEYAKIVASGVGGEAEQKAYLNVLNLRNSTAKMERDLAQERQRIEEDTAKKQIQAQEQISKLIKDRTSASLSDVEGGSFGRGMAARARRIRQLEERATAARVRGNDSLAERLAGRANTMRDNVSGLRDSERSAESAMASGFDKTVSAVEGVTEAIKALGEGTN